MQLINGPRVQTRHNAVKFAIFLIFVSALISIFVHAPIPGLALFVLLNTGLFIYWSPTFFAAWTGRPHVASITAVNTFLGFTGAGWVAALAWAFLDATGEEDQGTVSSMKSQLREQRRELEACKKQIDELRGYIILLNDHQSYANKMIEQLSKAKLPSPERKP